MNIGARVQRMERACPLGGYHVVSGWSRDEVAAKKDRLRADGKLASYDTLLSVAVVDGDEIGPAVMVKVRP